MTDVVTHVDAVPARPRQSGAPVALGLLLIATVLVSANYRLAVRSPVDLNGVRIAVGVLTVAWLSGHLDVRREWPRIAERVNQPLYWLFGLSLVTLLINIGGLAAAGTIAGGLKRLIALFGYGLAYSLTVALVHDRTAAVRATRILVALGAVGGVAGIVERLTGASPTRFVLGALHFEKYQITEAMTRGAGVRVYGTASHPIEYGVIMALLLPLAIHLVFNARTLPSRIGYALAAILISLGALFSVSRSAFIAAAVAMLVLTLLSRPRQGVTLAVAGVAGAVLAATLFPTIARSLERMLDPTWIVQQESMATSGRMQDWPIVWSLVKAHPIVGVGYDLFDPNKYFFLDNQYLKFVVELGVAGLACVGWLFVRVYEVGFTSFRRARAVSAVPLEAAVLAAVTSFIVSGFLFDSFGFFQVTTLFFILAGILVVVAACDAEPNASEA